MVEFGFPMGPLRHATSPGSISAGACARRQASRAEIADALCELGRFGQKTGQGFYRYEPGSRAPLPDPEVERLIVEDVAAARHQAAASLARRRSSSGCSIR